MQLASSLSTEIFRSFLHALKNFFKKKFIYLIAMESGNPKSIKGTPGCVTSWKERVQ
jgi:hypothetical protein